MFYLRKIFDLSKIFAVPKDLNRKFTVLITNPFFSLREFYWFYYASLGKDFYQDMDGALNLKLNWWLD